MTAWNRVVSDPFLYIGKVSCPSSALCVATTSSGQVVTSRKPATSGSWNTQLIDAPECAWQHTPCVAQQLYGHDSHGTQQLDSTPPGSARAIANMQFRGDLLTWTHNGTQRHAQLS